MKKAGGRGQGLLGKILGKVTRKTSIQNFLPYHSKWLSKALLGTALGLTSTCNWADAQGLPSTQSYSVLTQSLPPNSSFTESGVNPSGSTFSTAGIVGDPLAPAWIDPISRVPNMFGDFFGRGTQACRDTFTTQTLTFTGVGAEGGNFTNIHQPFTGPNGPKGPYTLTKPIFVQKTDFFSYTLLENTQLTPQVRAQFPGATFINGNGEFFGVEVPEFGSFLYNYLYTSGLNTCVNLPNPAGGGLVGRNRYFENGTAMPQDRVYFFYNRIGGYQGLGSSFDINRYVLGAEKTFLDNNFSLELRVPFAGTANSDQIGGQDLSVDHTEFGNIGLALKALMYRTPNCAVSIGLGVSAPTADDSRMLVGNTPVVEIENRTWLLQPMIGAAWAPTDRFYAQGGLQFDLDAFGNPVRALNANGGLSRVGVLNDQGYAFLNSSAGYWIYQNDAGRKLTGIALQGELDYNRSFGRHDSVQDTTITVADLSSNVDNLTGSAGAIFRFSQKIDLSVAVSFPLSGDRLYDWNLIGQLNYNFGGRH